MISWSSKQCAIEIEKQLLQKDTRDIKTSPSWKISLISGQPVSPGYDLAPHAEPESSVIPHYHRPFGGSTDVIVNNINRIVSNSRNIRLNEEEDNQTTSDFTSIMKQSSMILLLLRFSKLLVMEHFVGLSWSDPNLPRFPHVLIKSMGFLLISN